jgi:hypothetical protein
LNGISIPISPQTVHDVTGLPIGGKPIVKGNPVSGKTSLLGKMNLTSLPTFKDYAENCLKPDISDKELLHNFLIVVAVTFLCPNSTPYPSTEYMEPLVDVEKAKEWDWCKFVHYWLMKQIRKYHKKMKGPELSSTDIGGCLYIPCVSESHISFLFLHFYSSFLYINIFSLFVLFVIFLRCIGGLP